MGLKITNCEKEVLDTSEKFEENQHLLTWQNNRNAFTLLLKYKADVS